MIRGEPQVYVPQVCRGCGRERELLKGLGKGRPLLRRVADHRLGDAVYCADCRTDERKGT